MTYPGAIEVNGVEYEINTDYVYALAAIACINDPDLGDIERAYGVLEILYKEVPEDVAEALRLAVKYLQLGKETTSSEPETKRDMDYEQDMHFIRSSFRSDYGIDLNSCGGMHWWEFIELLQGLTDNCVLNRVRDIRNYDLTSVKDAKTRSKIRKAQMELALSDKVSQEDQDILNAFYEQLKTPET